MIYNKEHFLEHYMTIENQTLIILLLLFMFSSLQFINL